MKGLAGFAAMEIAVMKDHSVANDCFGMADLLSVDILGDVVAAFGSVDFLTLGLFSGWSRRTEKRPPRSGAAFQKTLNDQAASLPFGFADASASCVSF